MRPGPWRNSRSSALSRASAWLDNIELKKAGETVNHVNNSGFESGLSGWDLLGSHERSSVETSEGYGSNRSLHVRATSQGRYTISVYRITYDRLSTAITPPVAGETFTIRAKGRWIAGWPYIVIGVKGHALEAVGALNLPRNLGTPGGPNSRRVANAGPAISDVQHTPVLPGAFQNVVVSARVHDPERRRLRRSQVAQRHDLQFSDDRAHDRPGW